MENVSHRTKHTNDNWPQSQTYFSAHVDTSNIKFLDFIRIANVLKHKDEKPGSCRERLTLTLALVVMGGGGSFWTTLSCFPEIVKRNQRLSSEKKTEVASAQVTRLGQATPHPKILMLAPWQLFLRDLCETSMS